MDALIKHGTNSGAHYLIMKGTNSWMHGLNMALIHGRIDADDAAESS
jgi:uncharacterized protein YhhL (DUF1145 family)